LTSSSPSLSPSYFPPYFQALFDLAEIASASLYRVVRQDRGRVVVSDGVHQKQVTYRPRDFPLVGDYVAVIGERVECILERRQCLSRKDPGSGAEQPMAANVDLVVVVQPAVPLNLARIERGVTLAIQSGAGALVAVTKADLADVQSEVASRVPTADVVAVCALEGAGLDELKAHLSNRTSVLIGPSGAGKSTLLNALLGREAAATGAVRTGDHKGRHTTTARELYALHGGGFIIDTPGTRALGLVLSEDDAPGGFADIDTLAQACRFGDCSHQSEPGCAVVAAAAEGTLDASRLKSYFRQQRELRHLRETEHERRARFKRFAGMVSEAKGKKEGRKPR